MNQPNLERTRSLPALLLIILALGALLVAAALMMAPFVAPIVLALVLTTVGQPAFQRILRWVGEKRRGLAAALTILAVVLLLIAPLTWLAWSIVEQARDGVEFLRNNITRVHEEVESWAWYQRVKEHEWVKEFWMNVAKLEKEVAPAPGPAPGEPPPPPPPGEGAPGLEDQAAKAAPLLAKLAGTILGTAKDIITNVGQVALKFFLMLFILFYFLKDGPQLLHSLDRGVPLDGEYKRRAIETFRLVSQSIIRGSLGTALVQGVVAGLAFLIVGIPAIFWGAMVALCALIPPLGTALVTFPMAGILLLQGEWWRGIVLLVVAIAIGSMDNIIRPLMMGKSLPLHPLWLLISILGGLSLFGPMGLIYGPLVLVLLGTLLALFVRQEGTAAERAAPATQQPG